MDTFSQANIFFLISSIGFVVLWILVAIFLFYLIRAMATFSRIMDRIEGDLNRLGDVTKEVFSSLAESMIFNFFFKKKRRNSK